MSRNGRQTPRSGSVHHGHRYSAPGANTNNGLSTSQTQPSGTVPEQHLLNKGNTVNGYTSTSEKFLGRGNTGVVAVSHSAELKVSKLCQDNNGKAVAIKVMLEKGAGEIKATQLTELGNLRKLGSHKKIVEVIDSFSYVYNNGEYFCIVMECAKDGDLKALMQGSVSEVYAKAIIKQVCKGLEYIHSKHGPGEGHCVHADLKPGNILIKSLNPLKIMISDFASAEWVSEGHKHARTDNEHATIGYLSPERTRRKKMCCRTDLWAVGVILWELYHGWTSFEYFAYRIEGGFADDFDKLNDPRNWNTDKWKEYPEAKSVARRLLTLNCNNRWTASEVLRSNWLHKPQSPKKK